MAAFEFPPITINYGDGSTVIAEVWPVDVVRLEELTDESMSSLGDKMGMRHILPLAWYALKRSGSVTTTCDEWMETVKSFDMGNDDEQAPKDLGAPDSTETQTVPTGS
jgi:hypothetical protein